MFVIGAGLSLGDTLWIRPAPARLDREPVEPVLGGLPYVTILALLISSSAFILTGREQVV